MLSCSSDAGGASAGGANDDGAGADAHAGTGGTGGVADSRVGLGVSVRSSLPWRSTRFCVGSCAGTFAGSGKGAGAFGSRTG